MDWYVASTIALLVLIGITLVVAAFLDRRRAREIQHDRSRLPPGYLEQRPGPPDEPDARNPQDTQDEPDG
jgi:hypothetical protein